MADQPQPIQVQIAAEWLDPTDTPAHFSNCFIVQPIKDEFVLTFGIGAPPVMPPNLTVEDAKKLKYKIRPVVRIGMTPGRVIELIDLLQTQLKAYTGSFDREPN